MSRLAINLGDARHLSVAEMIEVAQAAERAGYEALFFGETWGWDIGLLLGVLATRTSAIRLGANIQNIFARTPSATAQYAATLDLLSNGRAIIGLGIATPAVVRDWHGVPYDRPAQRLRETVEILRQALSGQRLDYQGEIFRVQRFRLTVAPVQTRIPILLATTRARNVELTGRIADGWTPAFTTPQSLPILREHLVAGAAAAGRDPAEITVWPVVQAIVTDDPEPMRRLLRRHIAYYLGSQGSLHTRTLTQSGIFLDELQRIKEAYTKDSRSAERVVPDEMVDALMLVGSAAECRRRLADWHAAGADTPTLQLVVGTSFEDSLRTVEALGPAR
ncbi:MAG TPA: LLM class flavin-dependent oxidoreductase [Dehalococcoidia bacterium]|nr:LLM class flavin-dependent oxidoreductase [Dehalococcoidia bacterium]